MENQESIIQFLNEWDADLQDKANKVGWDDELFTLGECLNEGAKLVQCLECGQWRFNDETCDECWDR